MPWSEPSIPGEMRMFLSLPLGLGVGGTVYVRASPGAQICFKPHVRAMLHQNQPLHPINHGQAVQHQGLSRGPMVRGRLGKTQGRTKPRPSNQTYGSHALIPSAWYVPP